MSAQRHVLFPEIEPHTSGRLKVSDLHEIHWEESGNPRGKPVVCLHGGPGGGITPTMRRLHDPAVYRIVTFDQRGCGKSTPHAELAENTTWDLVADIERLRVHLGIERWQVYGGSWGSTLALAYAETHPERVSEMILRGIFMLRRMELAWFYQEGASLIFPDLFDPFRELIPVEERGDLIAAYHRRLTGPDEALRLEAAKRWATWEGSTLSLLPDAERAAAFGGDTFALAFARIECHFFMNGGFFEVEDQLLRDVRRLKDIPAVIVHGRYDMCTPMVNAWDLKKAWPEAELRIVDDGGHAVTEPGLVAEMVAASERFKHRPA
ncbi:prolyl aminopeptidase [Pinisolibacter aquiterrae]|uniref:prolyl aminopeptidase n=1 Tax=Pinisolibacter aquiterrae TaxID=2815579 RepID=UPI001C3D1561|nr:prolyl aminopeptidase [Pinisolibacter aquiterrae]MBV5266773.1 prolyl aminopeptidase [Pinisolibacter aquiterrae]MCC8234914.1 prolyl aminopeptidase [Pinisolibacter aquiterrae]